MFCFDHIIFVKHDKNKCTKEDSIQQGNEQLTNCTWKRKSLQGWEPLSVAYPAEQKGSPGMEEEWHNQVPAVSVVPSLPTGKKRPKLHKAHLPGSLEQAAAWGLHPRSCHHTEIRNLENTEAELESKLHRGDRTLIRSKGLYKADFTYLK